MTDERGTTHDWQGDYHDHDGCAAAGAEWSTIPANADHLPEWVRTLAMKRAEADPRVTAAQTGEAATADRETKQRRHEQERRALLVSEYGAERVRRDHLGMRTINLHRHARDARAQAPATHAEAGELRNLPMKNAAQASKPSAPSRSTPDSRQRSEHSSSATRSSTAPTMARRAARGQHES